MTWVAILLVVVGIILLFATCTGYFSSQVASNSASSSAPATASPPPTQEYKTITYPSGLSIVSCKVVQDEYGNDDLRVTFKNKSGKTITAATAEVWTEDDFGNSNDYSDHSRLRLIESREPLKNGKSRTLTFYHHGQPKVRECKVVEVLYDNGKVWPRDCMKRVPVTPEKNKP